MKPGAREVARFDFVLTYYAKEPGKAWLRSLTTWGWAQGVGLVYAMAHQNPSNVSDADAVLEAAEAAGVLRRGNINLDHSKRAMAGLRYGGASLGSGVQRRKKLDPRLAHPSDFAWQLTELGEEFFKCSN